MKHVCCVWSPVAMAQAQVQSEARPSGPCGITALVWQAAGGLSHNFPAVETEYKLSQLSVSVWASHVPSSEAPSACHMIYANAAVLAHGARHRVAAYASSSTCSTVRGRSAFPPYPIPPGFRPPLDFSCARRTTHGATGNSSDLRLACVKRNCVSVMAHAIVPMLAACIRCTTGPTYVAHRT